MTMDPSGFDNDSAEGSKAPVTPSQSEDKMSQATSKPVAASTFYAPYPPPLPTRPRKAGSSYTNYIEIAPPQYATGRESTPFREPELVGDDSTVPELTYPAEFSSSSWGATSNDNWGTGFTGAGWDTTGMDDSAWSGGHLGPSDFGGGATKKIVIDGRNEEEETQWWTLGDTGLGPGILPSLLEENLHHPEHTLFSVSVSPPDIRPVSPPEGSSSSSTSTFAVPTSEEVRAAVPHPSAYYCRRHNGWVILVWKSSSVFPPLAKSFLHSVHPPLPMQSRRKKTASCIGKEAEILGASNKTHHFHLYERAVDARQLNPPFMQAKYTSGDDNDDDEGDLLDLYVCCQCSTYCVASKVIPGVIPPTLIDDLTNDKFQNPSLGKTPEATVLVAWETVITVIENKLWRGENRALPIGGKGFNSKVGWNDSSRQIFECLGFKLTTSSPPAPQANTIAPPITDLTSADGQQNRARLLRAWVELSAWATDFQRRFATSLRSYTPHKSWIIVSSAREMYQTAIGAHHSQMPRGNLPSELMDARGLQLEDDCEQLGLTRTSFSWEFLAFAYMAQCRCDPAHTVQYFTHLNNIAENLQSWGVEIPVDAQTLIAEERSRGRFVLRDVHDAAAFLGFGPHGVLNMDLDRDVEDDFVVKAWKDGVRRSWLEPEDGSQTRKDLNEALRIIAQSRKSNGLYEVWEKERGTGMSLDQAYHTLEVPKDVEESMLITIYTMRVTDQPAQLNRMREALSVIAESRDSARLRQYLESGLDPGTVIEEKRPDWPRGLNQLGNTCYLNSLLQYFYTIKDLREAVAPLANADVKSLNDGKITDDDLKRHRVGGRIVTRREVLRSKRFVSLLADLFWQLEWCETVAVTPAKELAKLALVTSKDEEEDDVDKGATDSSHSTDATLVDDVPMRPSASRHESPKEDSPALASSPGSVLGKRTRDVTRTRSTMDVDSPTDTSASDKDNLVAVSRSSPPHHSSSSSSTMRLIRPSPPLEEPIKEGEDDDDVKMLDRLSDEEPQRPALHSRKKTVVDSSMMFGRQHDVAECMDNCMFQIETALLDFHDLAGSDDSKTSIVKRLFYGKIRQRLSVAADTTMRSSIHEKEDLFSHLPVNVSEEGFDIYDGLSGYFDDVVEFDGKKARMEVSLVDLPPLLQIQLQRVQFNRETLQPYKSQAYLKFGETICMDRFLDSADAQKKARSKELQADLTGCRDRIHTLTQGKYAPFGDALTSTADFLSKQTDLVLPEADSGLLAHLPRESELLKTRIDLQRTRAAYLKDELERVWEQDCEAAYELTSVFVHRGSSPSWGHYFFYSRHLPEQPDSWFKYNDSDVSAVSKDEVLKDMTQFTENPYLLVYARKGSEVVHTVKRVDPMSLEDAT